MQKKTFKLQHRVQEILILLVMFEVLIRSMFIGWRIRQV